MRKDLGFVVAAVGAASFFTTATIMHDYRGDEPQKIVYGGSSIDDSIEFGRVSGEFKSFAGERISGCRFPLL